MEWVGRPRPQRHSRRDGNRIEDVALNRGGWVVGFGHGQGERVVGEGLARADVPLMPGAISSLERQNVGLEASWTVGNEIKSQESLVGWDRVSVKARQRDGQKQ